MTRRPTEAGPAQPPPAPRGGRARGLIPALWLLFALLVLTGGWLFLRACGLDAIGLDYCPVPADHGALMREAAAGDALVRQVHMAQMAITDAPLCAPVPEVAPTPAVPPRDSESMDKRVQERGGKTGRLQFTLSWATLDDLDLNVDCPGGRIDSHRGHAGPGICGDGRKDIDANRNLTENVSTTPVENIVWQGDIPPGPYRIEVIQFRATTNQGNRVPFTLRIRWNGQERICSGDVTDFAPTLRKTEGGKTLSGRAEVLSWVLGDALPDCDWMPEDTFLGGDKG